MSDELRALPRRILISLAVVTVVCIVLLWR